MTNGKRQTDLLDRALRDLSPEQRARVLDLTLRLEIDRDDPLWLICLALGQLQVLVEDAPETWRGVFEAFSLDLRQWTDSNLQMLEAIARQAEAGADLTEVAKNLVTALGALTRLLTEQTQTSSTVGQEEALRHRLEDLRIGLDYRLTAISERLEHLATPPQAAALPTSGMGGRYAQTLLALLLAAVSGGGVVLWQGQQQQAQILRWLLYKANRQECVQKLAPVWSAQCRAVKRSWGP